MQAVRATRHYIKSSAISTAITCLCLIILIPQNIKKGYLLKDAADCHTNYFFIKNLSLFILFLTALYRIYFCSNWYIYCEYIPDDTCWKTMMIEVMECQRGYRLVYYGIITLFSSFIFMISTYFEYNNFKICLSERYSNLDIVYNKETNSFILIGIIIVVYLAEVFYLKKLVFYILKSWNHIDYGMGEMSLKEQIFFWRIKPNYIMLISYSIIISVIIIICIFL